MKSYKAILMLFSILLLTSFSRHEKEITSLEKIWVFESYDKQDKSLLFKSGRKFSKKRHGIQFMNNGKLKIHQNESWCATEPIIYETVDGNWERISDSVIIINHQRWGKQNIEKIQILELTETNLKTKTLR